MKHIYLLIIPAMIIACMNSVTTHHHESEQSRHNTTEEIVIEPEKAEKLGIKTITTKFEPFNAVIKTGGRIKMDYLDSWDIVANHSGKITFLKKNLSIGCQVLGQENLFKICSSDLNIQNNKAELDKYKAELEQAKSQYFRIKNLRKDRLATESELENAKKEFEIANTNYNKINNVINRNICAPYQGYIISLYASNGQYVDEGSTIATISSGKDIIVEADVPARFSSQIKNIIGANFSFGGQTYRAGNIISSSDIVSERGTIIPVHFKAEKTDGITAGIPVEIYVILSNTRNVITLPESAISERYGKYYAYIRLDDDCYREIEVSLGESDGSNIEITSPIEEGLEIVTNGVYYVKMARHSTSLPHGHSH